MAADDNTKAIEGVSCAGFNAGLFDRMRRMNRSWLERLREIHEIESEFGARLLAANSSAEEEHTSGSLRRLAARP